MTNTVCILGVPMDLGQERRGVDMGPSAIRYAGLQERLGRLGFETRDCGNIQVPLAEEITDPFDRAEETGRARHLPQIAQVCAEVYERAVPLAADPDNYLIFLGGAHSISIGTVAAVAQDESVGLVWVDAHGDINTPKTTPSGNVHGMCVAALLGDGPQVLTDVGYSGHKLRPEQVAMIGTRDLDAPEKLRLRDSRIAVYTMRDIDEHGVAPLARGILDRFTMVKHIHVSLDLDVLDPAIAPGVGTPVPGGLSYREAHLLMELLADSGKVRSVDLVEINPILDDGNSTGRLAVELVATLFGQRIL
ncbi:MAG: arginase [Anaerolineae bacterium]